MAEFILINGAAHWTGKTRTAAEAERNQQLNRVFADLDWEPIVIPFPQGIAVGFLNWAGNWESFFHWYHHTPEQRCSRGCTIHSERDRQVIHRSLTRHVAALVRDTEGVGAGLNYLLPGDDEGREDYLQNDVWQTAYKEARNSSKGDAESRDLADTARSAFALRPKRVPVASLDVAVELIEQGNPVPVTNRVWHECRRSRVRQEVGQFLVLKQGQIEPIWCYSRQLPDEQAWISGQIAGYTDEHKRFCLLKLEPDDLAIPARNVQTAQAIADRTKE